MGCEKGIATTRDVERTLVAIGMGSPAQPKFEVFKHLETFRPRYMRQREKMERKTWTRFVNQSTALYLENKRYVFLR